MRVSGVLGKFAVVAVKSVLILPYVAVFFAYMVDAAKREAHGRHEET